MCLLMREDGRFLLHRTAPDIAQLMEDTEIHGGLDVVIWAPSVSGDFKLVDTYEYIIRKKAPWLWYDLVWHPTRILRHAFIAWLVLKKRIKKIGKA